MTRARRFLCRAGFHSWRFVAREWLTAPEERCSGCGIWRHPKPPEGPAHGVVAREFGISQSTVSLIVSGKRWGLR